MTEEHKKAVLNYFKNKAQNYDLVENQLYWRLSDKLLWETFSEQVLQRFSGNDFFFLDAGGGTGRWSFKILNEFPTSSGMIYDLSPEMLDQAKAKVNNLSEKRIGFEQGDLHNIGQDDDVFDLTFNFHNVLGFVSSPTIVLREMTRVTKEDCYVVSFVPNLYHAIYFNIYTGNIKSAADINKSENGKFTDEMPNIHFFTPDKLSQLYQDCGLDVILVTGFPAFLYPGVQETKISGSSKGTISILDNAESFESISEIEKSFILKGECSARGNNIFVVGKKRKRGRG